MSKKSKPKPNVSELLASKVLEVVDRGLSSGLGKPEPGKMCVEAAVAYAYGEPHDDAPTCVHPELAGIKISLNDQHGWLNNKSRAAGMRRLAIAQLGSANVKFKREKFYEIALELATPIIKSALRKLIENKKTTLGTLSNIRVAPSGRSGDLFETLEGIGKAHLTSYKQRSGKVGQSIDDKVLATIAEIYVQALIRMKLPGTKYLYLTEKKKKSKTRKKK